MTGILEEDLKRANDERKQIVRKYQIGRENINDINKWEDPDYGDYYKIDRYGFIHPESLPAEFDESERKDKEVEMQRAQKWLKMRDNWKKISNTEKLHRRIFKGIPDKLRREIYIKMLNVEESMKQNPREYQRILEIATVYSMDIRQIDNDINRCFRDHEFYCKRYSTKQQQLFNILIAYSMYNTEVGYCQGMSTIAALLLLYLNEEESFWALHTLMIDKKFSMHGLYIVGFPKLMRFMKHHDKILTKFLPRVKKHFDKQNLDAVLYSLKWFFVIFVERIPFSLCLRVIDVYFLYGERVMTAMAFNILKLHEKKLLKQKDMDAITEFLQYKLQKNFGYTDNYVIKKLEETMIELKAKRMDLPPPPGEEELPKCEMGIFIEPTIEQKLGLRSSIFSETEKHATDYVIALNDHENGNDGSGDDDEQVSDQLTLNNLNAVTNLSDYEGDLSFMDDEIDDITYTTSNPNRKSITGTSVTSLSEDRQSISTLNQQNQFQIADDDEDDYEIVD